jgi:hypothetical protein
LIAYPPLINNQGSTQAILKPDFNLIDLLFLFSAAARSIAPSVKIADSFAFRREQRGLGLFQTTGTQKAGPYIRRQISEANRKHEQFKNFRFVQ